MKIIPVSEMGRPPEQGRIRYGIKQGKIPRSITCLRFTSSDVTALTQISALYGGTVNAWERGQSEVITKVSEVPIILPPDPLAGSPVYELWGGSSCTRRCDGVSATIPSSGPDGADLIDVPCVCNERGKLECKPTTRLRVILPEIRFAGVWRLDCKGWHGTMELPSMVAMVEQMQGRGLSRAFLALEPRQKGSKKFVVPMLRLGSSVNEIMSGSPITELSQGNSIPELPAGPFD